MKKYPFCLFLVYHLDGQAYENAFLTIPTRVEDLVSGMTLEEKVAQLCSICSVNPQVTDALLASRREMDSLFGKGLGMVNLSQNGDTISMNNFQYIDPLVLPDHQANLRKINSTVSTARDADVIICAVGENGQYFREAEVPNRYGDNATLDLPSDQDALIKAMVAVGKPVIVYLAHGRPLPVNYAAAHADAIVDGWFTGQESGNDFANILFGDVNPSGKLTISIPRCVGQIPIYYSYKVSTQFLRYVTDPNTSVFPFGFGLSCTEFHYDLSKINGRKFSVAVINAGQRQEIEIVQVYIHSRFAEVTQSVKSLRAFSRVDLMADESKQVDFYINDDMLADFTKDRKRQTASDIYDTMVGPNSIDLQTVKFKRDYRYFFVNKMTRFLQKEIAIYWRCLYFKQA